MSFQAAILQQTAEYIYQLEQEKTRLLSQNSQLKRLYSLSQQGLTSPAGNSTSAMSSTGADDTTSPRLKKKRTNTTTTTVSLENTSDLLKTSSNEDNAASTVAELSLQLLNEQRLRQRLEERLKTLEQASNINTTTTQVVTTVAPPSAAASAPAVPVVAAAVASATPTVVVPQPATNLLPTQPLKMEVVEKQQQTSTVTVQASATSRPPALSARPPPGTILLADKNGMQVKVEAVHGLPQVSSFEVCPNKGGN